MSLANIADPSQVRFEWRSGDWTPCSQTCGDVEGMQVSCYAEKLVSELARRLSCIFLLVGKGSAVQGGNRRFRCLRR